MATGAEVRLLDLKDPPVPVLDAELFDATNSDPHRLYNEGGRCGRHTTSPPRQTFCDSRSTFDRR